jgi:hypothetical protein
VKVLGNQPAGEAGGAEDNEIERRVLHGPHGRTAAAIAGQPRVVSTQQAVGHGTWGVIFTKQTLAENLSRCYLGSP